MGLQNWDTLLNAIAKVKVDEWQHVRLEIPFKVASAMHEILGQEGIAAEPSIGLNATSINFDLDALRAAARNNPEGFSAALVYKIKDKEESNSEEFDFDEGPHPSEPGIH